MAGTLEVPPPRHSFFSETPTPFPNLGLEVVPPAEKGETDTVKSQSYR